MSPHVLPLKSKQISGGAALGSWGRQVRFGAFDWMKETASELLINARQWSASAGDATCETDGVTRYIICIYYLHQGRYVSAGFCLSVCVCVSKITQKVMEESFWNFEGISGMAKTTSDSILGVIRKFELVLTRCTVNMLVC